MHMAGVKLGPVFAAGYENKEQAMNRARRFANWLLPLALAALACGALTPVGATPPVETTRGAAPTVEPNAGPNGEPSVEPSAAPADATATTAPTAVPTASPVPTEAPLALEIVQTQTWTDYLGNARLNVLLHNPYDFPVEPNYGARAVLRDSAGGLMQEGDFYFLDGISGGGGYLLPGETIAANACFTCEEAVMTEPWATVEVFAPIQDATGEWNTSTEVEPTVSDVSFDGDSPIFYITGTVKNNSADSLQRISVRVTVFDEAGLLVGAAEASAWDVAAGATADFNSYGIGQTPAGPITYTVTALGVNY